MKIKLISPKMTLRPMDSEFKRLMAPSLGLLVLAALTPEEHQVYIEDENVQKINFEDNPDLVGITVNIDTCYKAFKIAKKYKDKNIPVIFGGIYASVRPEESLKYCDSVCIGEAEELWGQIISDLKDNNLKQIYFNDDITSLNKVPIPDRNLIKKSNYLYTNVLCTSRGCPFKCDFCYNSCNYTNNVFRNRPIENVIEEIKAINNNHVMFIDDNFIGNPDWTKEFIKQITPLKLKWNAAVSTNIIKHLDLLDEMKKSGCQSLFIGFETINNESIESVHKYQNNVETYESLINELHVRNIMINASLVFGFDHDKPGVFKDTLKWLVDNKIETVTAHILTPYPGTKLFDKLEKEGRIIDYNLEHYNTSHVVFEPKHLTKEELFDGYIWLYKKFYTMKNIIKRLPEKSEQHIPYLLFNFGYRKYGNYTSKIAKLTRMCSFGNIASKFSYKSRTLDKY